MAQISRWGAGEVSGLFSSQCVIPRRGQCTCFNMCSMIFSGFFDNPNRPNCGKSGRWISSISETLCTHWPIILMHLDLLELVQLGMSGQVCFQNHGWSVLSAWQNWHESIVQTGWTCTDPLGHGKIITRGQHGMEAPNLGWNGGHQWHREGKTHKTSTSWRHVGIYFKGEILVSSKIRYHWYHTKFRGSPCFQAIKGDKSSFSIKSWQIHILFKYIFSNQKSVDVNLVLALDRMAKPGPNPWDVKRSSSLIHTNFGQPAPGTFKKYQRSLILKHNAIHQEVTFSFSLASTNQHNEWVSEHLWLTPHVGNLQGRG